MNKARMDFMTTICFLINVGLFAIVVVYPFSVFAENLGVYGSIYSISEPDMLTAIHEKLEIMKGNGELASQKKNFIDQSIKHILRPSPVKNVTDLGSLSPKSYLFNPSIILDKNITNLDGEIIAKAGTKINPLKIKSFDEALIFINGDNTKEINWTFKAVKKYSRDFSDIKIILVNGDINTSAKALNHRVYFDQDGVLCKRFDIQHTPTMVYQDVVNGLKIPRLMIKEFSYE